MQWRSLEGLNVFTASLATASNPAASAKSIRSAVLCTAWQRTLLLFALPQPNAAYRVVSLHAFAW